MLHTDFIKAAIKKISTDSMTIIRVLFDFRKNENYLTIDLCFHPCTVTSIDHWYWKSVPGTSDNEVSVVVLPQNIEPVLLI